MTLVTPLEKAIREFSSRISVRANEGKMSRENTQQKLINPEHSTYNSLHVGCAAIHDEIDP